MKVVEVPEQIFEPLEEMLTPATTPVFTVTNTVSLDVQLPLVRVKTYAVVDVGVAIGFAIFGLLNPEDGLHK